MDDPALLLLHMFGGSALSWEPVVARLGARRRCVAFDQRGFGSAAPPGPDATLADWADDAAEAAAGLDRYVLVGHSMGGKVATLLASRRPPGLVGLVLVAPSPPTPEPIPDRSAMRRAWGDAAAAGRTAREISAAAKQDAVLFDRLVADQLRASRAAWDWWVDLGSREDIAEAAGRVAVPTLVLAGADDGNIPARVVREVAARIPDAECEVVPESRHMVPFDAPGALAARIARWAI